VLALKNVQKASADRRAALELFKQTDADGSGMLDEEEFGNLLNTLGDR